MKRNLFFTGMKDGVPIALGYFAVSFTLGIAASGIGVSPFRSCLMSALMLASAGEYAFLNTVASVGTYFEMALTILVINLRYLLFSTSLSQKLSDRTGLCHRLLMGYAVTDELFGICSVFPGELSPYYLYGAALISASAWTAGTGFGALLGNVLPPMVTSALSVSLYGMFLASVLPTARKKKFVALLVAVSMLSSAAMTRIPFLSALSSGFRVIFLTVVLAALAAVVRPIEEEKA